MMHSDLQSNLDQSIRNSIVKSTKRPEAYVDSLSSIFEIFDPKSGKVDDWKLRSIAYRARVLLEKRSKREIKYATRTAQWMIQNPVDIMTPWNDPILLDSLPRALYQRRQLFKIDSMDDLPNAQWSDFLAALALAYVGVTDTGHADRKPEALEAVCLAEEAARFRLTDRRLEAFEATNLGTEAATIENKVREGVKQIFSAHQRTKAQKRHAPGNALKEKAIEYVTAGINEGRFRFVTQGVRSFEKTLSNEELNLFDDNYRMRALCNAVYEYRKKQSQSPKL